MTQPLSPSSMRLKDKVILVTGSTTGIGEGMVRLFAREGAQVMIHGRRKDAAQKLAAEIGERASFVIGALEDPQVPARAYRRNDRSLWKNRRPRKQCGANQPAAASKTPTPRTIRPDCCRQPEGAVSSDPGGAPPLSETGRVAAC